MDLEKSKKNDAKSRLIRFLTKSDIVLTGEEEKILTRWEYADRLMRQRTFGTEAIRIKIQQEFGVSRFTADNDIFSAQEIFAKTRQLNKKYIAHLHLEDIQTDIRRIRQRWYENGSIPDNKEISALAKLHDSYTRQLDNLPDETPQQDVQRPIIIFELVGAQDLKMPMDVDRALKLADRFINNLPILDVEESSPDESE